MLTLEPLLQTAVGQLFAGGTKVMRETGTATSLAHHVTFGRRFARP